MFVRLIQVLQSISQSIISPNTCSLFLHVHDKSFCLSRSLPLIHPSLCFHSLARVPHAGSGLRGLSMRLLADALCKAAGVLAHLAHFGSVPRLLSESNALQMQLLWLLSLWAKMAAKARSPCGSWFRKRSKTRLLCANSKPRDTQNWSSPSEKMVLSSFVGRAVTTLADAWVSTIINDIPCG